MANKEQQVEVPVQKHKNTKANRFDETVQVEKANRTSWSSQAVVYLGHLPHGFLEDELKSYFGQYGEVLAVKVARSKKTARSKGYAFVQFKYPEVAQIVAQTMNGYLLLGKVIVCHVLPAGNRNPFTYASSHQYKYINWKRLFALKTSAPKTEEETALIVHKMLKRQQQRRTKFQSLGIAHQFPGFKQYLPVQVVAPKQSGKQKQK